MKGQPIPLLLPYGPPVELPAAFDAVLSDRDFGPPRFAPRLVYWYDGQADYPRALGAQWQQAVPFLLVEDDNAPTARQLRELADCPEPWCVHGYAYPDRAAPVYALGCVKFDPARLVEILPAEFARLRSMQLDDFLQRVLRRSGFEQHRHGLVGHLHARRRT